MVKGERVMCDRRIKYTLAYKKRVIRRIRLWRQGHNTTLSYALKKVGVSVGTYKLFIEQLGEDV